MSVGFAYMNPTLIGWFLRDMFQFNDSIPTGCPRNSQYVQLFESAWRNEDKTIEGIASLSVPLCSSRWYIPGLHFFISLATVDIKSIHSFWLPGAIINGKPNFENTADSSPEPSSFSLFGLVNSKALTRGNCYLSFPDHFVLHMRFWHVMSMLSTFCID